MLYSSFVRLLGDVGCSQHQSVPAMGYVGAEDRSYRANTCFSATQNPVQLVTAVVIVLTRNCMSYVQV